MESQHFCGKGKKEFLDYLFELFHPTFFCFSALLSVLAQAGMFVPATYAELGIVDQILSRMGSSDNLTGDQSSFMVRRVQGENRKEVGLFCFRPY